MADIVVGGQAVLEGVMMRAPGVMATAVRRMNGAIEIQTSPLHSIADARPWLRKPFFRGVLALGQALVLGFKALNFSSAVAMEDIEAEEKGEAPGKTEAPAGMSTLSIIGVLTVTLVLGVGFFFLLPLYLTELTGKFSASVGANAVIFNLVEGAIRVTLLLLYLRAIAFFPDLKRVFQYHGAEHKAIFAYEAGLPLTVENARKFSRFHPRCGTAFLLMVMIIAVLVFSVVPSTAPLWVKVASRLALLPVIAAVSYEIIRKAGKGDSKLFNTLIVPGLWLQRLTTREPDDEQIEVGLAALRSALADARHAPSDMII